MFPFRSLDSISGICGTYYIWDPYFGTEWALILVMIEQVHTEIIKDAGDLKNSMNYFC